MHGRLLLGLMVLTLVPALVGVVLASVLTQAPPDATASERSRLSSAAATDLLMRAQGIETRLSALAADPDLARLTATATNAAARSRARRSMSSLRGSDGSIVTGACITRLSDGRTAVMAEDSSVLEPGTSCAQGTLLRSAADAVAGTVVRSLDPGSGQLLIATPLAISRPTVLSASVDLERLLERTPATARTAATSVVIDRDTSDFVAGTTRVGQAEPGTPAPMPPQDLAFYAEGITSGYPATVERLTQAGWTTTVAELWPTLSGGGVDLIQSWPAPASTDPTMFWATVVVVALMGLVGVLVLMRLLLEPFRELREERAQLESKYRAARADSLQDGLTGLGNHRAFQDELARQIELSERDGVPFVLMLADLDNLKTVNDREGHAEGDKLLEGLARAMRETLRPADRVFRIGGDEFAILMPGLEPEQAMEAAERMRLYCLRPPGGGRPTPFSGGISAVPRFSLEATQVQRQADGALYWAKRHGRGFVELFDPQRDELADERGPAGLGNVVYEIARDHLFAPVYQPIVDLRTGAVLGFEGLVRPEPGGPIPDSERLFAAAAATGRTVELDLASFEAVVDGANGIGSDHLISVNISAKTLEIRDFDAAWLLNTLVRHGISPARVILELTEREPIEDVKRLQNNVHHLGEYGLRLAADDVGAGSAGLRMLAEIPFDIVKIDLSLVQSGSQHAASWAVLRSIRDLAWRQRSVIIGEGVETADQLRALQQLEIPVGQGYLLGRPAPEIDTRPRDLANLVVDPQSGLMAPPRTYEDVRGLPSLPELQVEDPGPRPAPIQLGSLPVSQLQPAT